MIISMKDLNSKTPDIKGEHSNIYFLSEKFLAKRFFGCYGIQRKNRFQRYEIAKQMLDLDEVILPVDVLETEKGFCGYVEPVVPGTFSDDLMDFADFVNKNRNDITLEAIASYILKCAKIVHACHKHNIVNPDMASAGNILYNKNNEEVYFTDYQDMQVNHIPSDVVSSFIVSDPVLTHEKYQSNHIYTKNIDWYTLAITFFYYTTKINVPRAINTCSMEEMLKLSGIADTSFGDCMRGLYNLHQDNKDIFGPIHELCKEYKLTPFKQGQIRTLIKK